MHVAVTALFVQLVGCELCCCFIDLKQSHSPFANKCTAETRLFTAGKEILLRSCDTLRQNRKLEKKKFESIRVFPTINRSNPGAAKHECKMSCRMLSAIVGIMRGRIICAFLWPRHFTPWMRILLHRRIPHFRVKTDWLGGEWMND